MELNIEKNEQYYQYLYQLQRSGRTNMVGARPYLQERFGLKSREAEEVLITWMENYDEIAQKLGIEV